MATPADASGSTDRNESAPANTESHGYRLAVTSIPEDRDSCVKAIHETLGWTSIDAKQRLRHVPSVWPDLIDESSASGAAERLRYLGANVIIVPAADVPDLQQARTLHHVQCTEAGLAIFSVAGDPEAVVNWGDISVLSVASVGGLNTKMDHPLPNGVFRHASGIARYDDTPERYGLELWIVAGNPARIWRVAASEMNYQYLGDRLSPASDENFSTLVNDLQRLASHAALSTTTESYLRETSGMLDYRLASSQVHGELAIATWAMRTAS